MRHRWVAVPGNLRKDWRQPGCKTDHCVQCGIWRQYLWESNKTWYLSEPYGSIGYPKAPSCPDVGCYMRAVAPELFIKGALLLRAAW